MKPFDLKRALAGDFVILRNGSKAIVKYNLIDEVKELKTIDSKYPLKGYQITNDGYVLERSWGLTGASVNQEILGADIVGMWEELRPTVTLTLPCPLKEPREVMWLLGDIRCYKNILKKGDELEDYQLSDLENGLYFATEEDANQWLKAMRDNKR